MEAELKVTTSMLSAAVTHKHTHSFVQFAVKPSYTSQFLAPKTSTSLQALVSSTCLSWLVR